VWQRLLNISGVEASIFLQITQFGSEDQERQVRSGFAVGRTSFWKPLVNWRASRIGRVAAVKEISRRYQQFVEAFESKHRAVHA